MLFGELKSDKAVELIIETIHDENLRGLRFVLLPGITSNKAIELIIEALHDRDENVRNHAGLCFMQGVLTINSYGIQIKPLNRS